MEKLNELSVGSRGTVVRIGGSGALRRRIIDMGITPGTQVVMGRPAPLGDPLQITVRGYELSIRKSEAQEILVEEQGEG